MDEQNEKPKKEEKPKPKPVTREEKARAGICPDCGGKVVEVPMKEFAKHLKGGADGKPMKCTKCEFTIMF